ncbi:hypothetical protein E2C01_080237 [Portunus trituberculatus]|uniref:Uncharacterized protein n=1 Tax=Portunus trituberculatus TaxID=210409 RepID=A0A5B7ITJ3_PORTR|nr:hypothetical protein [Portunus trituberculatus]
MNKIGDGRGGGGGGGGGGGEGGEKEITEGQEVRREGVLSHGGQVTHDSHVTALTPSPHHPITSFLTIHPTVPHLSLYATTTSAVHLRNSPSILPELLLQHHHHHHHSITTTTPRKHYHSSTTTATKATPVQPPQYHNTTNTTPPYQHHSTMTPRVNTTSTPQHHYDRYSCTSVRKT